MSDRPLLLYSAGTWLAYAIAERFYGGIHYVWCSPFYDGATAARHVNVPPSSSPAEIYRNMEEETRRGDLHSDAIKRNIAGIRGGARMKWEGGAITSAQLEEIEHTVTRAKVPDFHPVLFVIPFDRIADLVSTVPVGERAHPLSVEYRVEALPSGYFDLLELRR